MHKTILINVASQCQQYFTTHVEVLNEIKKLSRKILRILRFMVDGRTGISSTMERLTLEDIQD